MSNATKDCTVKELREFLANLPDNHKVAVLKEVSVGYTTTTIWVPLTLPTTIDGCTDTFDVTNVKVWLGER